MGATNHKNVWHLRKRVRDLLKENDIDIQECWSGQSDTDMIKAVNVIFEHFNPSVGWSLDLCRKIVVLILSDNKKNRAKRANSYRSMNPLTRPRAKARSRKYANPRCFVSPIDSPSESEATENPKKKETNKKAKPRQNRQPPPSPKLEDDNFDLYSMPSGDDDSLVEEEQEDVDAINEELEIITPKPRAAVVRVEFVKSITNFTSVASFTLTLFRRHTLKEFLLGVERHILPVPLDITGGFLCYLPMEKLVAGKLLASWSVVSTLEIVTSMFQEQTRAGTGVYMTQVNAVSFSCDAPCN